MSAAEPARVFIKAPTEYEMQAALLGMKGIFKALQWIESGELRGVDDEHAIEAARDNLVSAGVMLSSMICDAF